MMAKSHHYSTSVELFDPFVPFSHLAETFGELSQLLQHADEIVHLKPFLSLYYCPFSGKSAWFYLSRRGRVMVVVGINTVCPETSSCGRQVSFENETIAKRKTHTNSVRFGDDNRVLAIDGPEDC